MAKQDEYVRYTIRVPADLYERLKVSAGEKSVNAEVVERLDRSFYENTEDNFLRQLSDSQFYYNVLPPGLAGRIQSAAETNRRSVQEEVVQALEAAFPPASDTDQLIEVLDSLLNSPKYALLMRGRDQDVSTKNLREYLRYLIEERDAGRGEGARARLQQVFDTLPDGAIVRRK